MEYGVTQFAVNAMPVAQPSAISLRDADRWHTVFGGSSKTDSGIRVTHTTAMGYPPFWRGVNLLANAVARLPLDVFRRDGDDRSVAETHPAQRLLKRMANPVMCATSVIQTLTGHAAAVGNGYAVIERGDRMQPVELWPLDPSTMLIRYVDGELWYCTTIDGRQVKIPGRDVLHIKGLSHNGVIGHNPVQLMADAMGVGMAAQSFGARFFGSGTNTSGILMVPGHFDETKIRNTMSAWKDMNAGLQNAHKVALLQDGAKYQPMSVAPEQAQFLETRQFEVRTVALMLGLPSHLLGDDSRISYNSLEQENRAFLDHSLDPWLVAWEKECSNKLLSTREQDRNTHYIEFNREAAVKMQVREKIDAIVRQIETGLLTVNEGRRLLNEAEIGDDGDKRYHPANWMEIGAEPVVPDTMPANGDDEPEDDDGTDDALTAMIASSVTDAVSIERRRVVTAAKKEQNFCTWLDDFYATWEARSVSGLQNVHACNVKAAYADESRRQLLDVAGSSTTATLAGNVEALVTSWDDRTQTLTTNLVRAAKQ